jgi:hypothetical protein
LPPRHKEAKKHKVEEFATKAQRHEETQSRGILLRRHKDKKKHKVEEFCHEGTKHEETQSGVFCHEGTKTRRNTKWSILPRRHKDTKKHKEVMINTKAIYYKIINLVPLSALVPSWQKNSWQKTSLQKLCGQTFLS